MIVILIVTTSCATSEANSKEYYYGNTTNNIINSGYFGEDTEWIYGSLNYYQLYKLKSEKRETSFIKISDDIVDSVNVQGEWIYYSSRDWGVTKKGIYKIKKDGSNKVRISEDKAFKVLLVDEYLYYSTVTLDDNNNRITSLFKIKTDGTLKTLLIENEAEYLSGYNGEFVISNGYIYYVNTADNYRIYSIKMDGTDNKKVSDEILGDEHGIGKINVEGDWIYYTKITNSNRVTNLYRMKLDGTEISNITSDDVADLNVDGEWIYYTMKFADTLFKMKADGTGKIKLENRQVQYINITSQWIFCEDVNQEGVFLQIDKNDLSIVNELNFNSND